MLQSLTQHFDQQTNQKLNYKSKRHNTIFRLSSKIRIKIPIRSKCAIQLHQCNGSGSVMNKA